MGQALIVLLYLITGAALLLVNWAIWFILLPTMFRQLRDQFRRSRDRKPSN
jgi:hypothetical protein